MGSIQTHRESGLTDRQFFENEFPEALTQNGNIIASVSRRTGYSMKGSGWPFVFIAAVRNTDGKTWALVIPFSRSPRGYWNMTYKAMDETMGVGYSQFVTEDILHNLSDTTSQYALEWREEAEDALRKAAEKGKPQKGDTIKFARAWDFQDGSRLDTFTFEGYCKFTNENRRYRLPSTWRTADFTIVK